ncbi:replication initiator protein A [Staphylococcus epidermidis]|uniref:replication initiator protein A n=1 Tax=Staphylococcus epidermidis TaxID=1282 RepID=UPI0034D712DF
MSNNYFTITEQYREKFYQLPKVFFTNDNYKKLSNDAKISYAILKDRLDLSIQNNWVDQDGNIYFIYTVKQLEDILNCGNQKVSKIKKELEKVNLLIQKRQGLNKPNLLYLLKPEIQKSDIYTSHEESENKSNSLQDKEMLKSHVRKCENHTSGNVKITRQDMLKSHASDTDTSHTHTSDTDTTTTSKKESSSSNKWIEVIKNDLNITMTKKYKKELAVLLTHFNDEVITYAIEHTSLYAKNPKPFLLKILKTWKQANVKTVDNAIEYKVSKDNVVKFNREKTPEWLTDQEKQEDDYLKDNENDEQFEKERKAFIEKLKEDWGE